MHVDMNRRAVKNVDKNAVNAQHSRCDKKDQPQEIKNSEHEMKIKISKYQLSIFFSVLFIVHTLTVLNCDTKQTFFVLKHWSVEKFKVLTDYFWNS